MAIQVKNPLLSNIMRCIRHSRPRLSVDIPFYNRVERAHGGNYVEVWFLTSGCRWDADGGCTMCNYGQGPTCSEDEIVDAVRQGLAAINVEVNELFVSPSGSMLNPYEVPPNARRCIYSLVRDFPAPQFAFLTRPETVTVKTIKEFTEYVPDKRLGVEMGLESSNAWVQRFCINKGSHPDQFTKAAQILTKYGINVYADVSLGTALLSPTEAINDAVNSAQWAFANGADSCVLLPLHVKHYTLLKWLYQRGLYHPPSLWSLIEVLRKLGPELMSKTEISWYRNYYNDECSNVILSPTTCRLCQDKVLELLDEYRNSRSSSTIKQLDAIQCECKTAWQKEIRNIPTSPLPERVLKIYKELAYHFLSEDWWHIHGPALQSDLVNNYINV